MKFSVIIPLYNKAPYIRKALESVLAQTYMDYELIIVDDGSTDGSADVAEAIVEEAISQQGNETKGMENSAADTLASRLSPLTSNLTSDSAPASRLSPLAFRLRLLKQPNQGVSAARNTGVAASTGDYVAFLDADDWWEPTYLERMAQLIEDYPDAGLYACNYYYHKDGVNVIKVDIPTGYFNYPKEYFKNFAMPIWTGATVIPHNVYDESGGFPVGIKLGEDFLLWAKIAVQYPVAFLNEPLAYYNNTLPPNYRATYHLHKPEEHMLFRLEVAFGYEEECKVESVKCKGMKNEVKGEGLKAKGTEDGETDNTEPHRLIASSPYRLNEDWRRLIDMLRLLGLHSYWLSDEYHEIAQREIDKVDMSLQYEFLVKLYRQPRWVQRLKQRLLRMAAGPIGLLKRLKQKKNAVQTNIIINNREYRKSMGLEV